MKFKFLTVSVALLFAFCSFGHVVQSADLGRSPLAAVLETLKEDEDDDE